jgi:Flp pilus assembly protein TadG
MFKFLRKILGDRRGNALIIAGLSLPLVVGAAGLGTDTVQWVVWKRELQRAADSAAFAGVYARAQDNAAMTAAQAVSSDLNKNNHTMVSLLAGYPQVAYPTSPNWTNAVQVTLAVQKNLGFSGLFLSSGPTITATATAAMVEDASYCAVGLAETGSSIQIGGSTNTNMGCGVISSSRHATQSVSVSGGAHTFIADPVAGVGGVTSTVNGATAVLSFQAPMKDPYADVPTSIPPGETCRAYNHPQMTNPDGSKKPGCYSSFNVGNGTTVLSPGTYYLDSTSIKLVGQEILVGNGVTIILTGSKPGTLDMAGNSSLQLTAPTNGTYENMVLIQSPNATAENSNKINGDNGTVLDGAIYFPKGNVQLLGNSTQAYQCAMLVAYRLQFSGNSTIQNNTSSCTAAEQVSGQRVRLVV